MRKEKDVWRHEKLQVLYWLKTQTVDSVLSAAVRRTGNIVPQYKDGCLVTLEGGMEDLHNLKKIDKLSAEFLEGLRTSSSNKGKSLIDLL